MTVRGRDNTMRIRVDIYDTNTNVRVITLPVIIMHKRHIVASTHCSVVFSSFRPRGARMFYWDPSVTTKSLHKPLKNIKHLKMLYLVCY